MQLFHFYRIDSNDINKTIEMVRDFETLGASAVAVHGRTVEQSREDPVDKSRLPSS